MINLAAYRKYWQSIADRITCVSGLLPVTIDKEMGKKIQSLPPESITLFVFPPLADSAGRGIDAFKEENQCVVFVMKKYNPLREASFDILEQTQHVAETIKQLILDDSRSCCLDFTVDVGSIETAPETELYGVFAGWSIAFKANTSGL